MSIRALVINSYAGSITIGLSSLGAEIIGSYEDANFFLDVQKRNFPHLNFREYYGQWPAQDLSETLVLAHPPCSAFSLLNTSEKARGADSKAFSCTTKVLGYAMKNNALAIAVESVMGALVGAWNIHQHFADTYGYHCYRILENGCMFGAQWRERFWVVFVRKGVSTEDFHLALKPKYQTVAEVVTGYEDGPSPGNLDVLLERQKQRLIEGAKCTPEEMSFFFDKQDPPHRTMGLGGLLWEHKIKKEIGEFPTPEEKADCIFDHIGGFSGGLTYIDPNGTCPVLLGGSHWYYNGRNMSENGYKLLMGFPLDYTFPETPRNYRRQMRTGLSKGVMPPIAAWIGEQLAVHVGMMNASYSVNEPVYYISCRPNGIADFRIRKQDWWRREAFGGLPPLREHDERDEARLFSRIPHEESNAAQLELS